MQNREKKKVLAAVPGVGVCVCAVVNTVICTWLLYHLAVKDIKECSALSATEESVVLGFSETRISDYPSLEGYFETWEHACVLVVFCLLANIFNLPKKFLLLDTVSVLLVWHVHGWEFTITVIAISIAFSVIGAYIGRSPLCILILGILMLLFIKEVLTSLLPPTFVKPIFDTYITYPAFYACVVRAIILGIEHARMRSVSVMDLLRNSIGYTVMSPVSMANSFVLFQDWINWREGTTKFTVRNRHHLEEERHPSYTGETVRRTVSIRRILFTVLRLTFWTLVLKYGLGSIDFIRQTCGPVRRISRGLNVHQLDGFIAYFIAFINVGKFSLYFVVFYGYGRIIGDLQQFMLSPLFERDTTCLVVVQGDTQLLKSSQACSLGEKLMYSEVTMNCLMPDGPNCLLGTLQSSEVWRTFDRGLYIVLKHYIYFPWRKLMLSTIPATSVAFKELGAISGAMLTFIFVLSFHQWSSGNRVWVCSSLLLWCLEHFGVQYYKSMRAQERLTSLLSTKWELRIRCFGYATLQTLNILGFMFFLANYNAGYWLAKAVLTNWLVLLECWVFIYINIRLSVQIRTWTSQSVEEDHKVK